MKNGYKFSRTLTFAWRGIKFCIRNERNMRFHLIAGTLAVVVGFLQGISLQEWAILSLTITLVLVLEMINTAIENVVDMFTTDYHPLAEVAKNVAAGAVLVAALNALVVGAVIFLK